MYYEILLEMIRQADISRDMIHYESFKYLEYDINKFRRMRKTVDNMHEYIMTIISML